jgi:hypothetical protein
MTSTYDLSTLDSASALVALQFEQRGRVVVTGRKLADALMGALVDAEIAAARCGVTNEHAAPGVGEARDVIGNFLRWDVMVRAPASVDVSPDFIEAIQTLYFAAHGAVRRVLASARVVEAAPFLGVAASGDVRPVRVHGIAAELAAKPWTNQGNTTGIEVDGEALFAVVRVALDLELSAASFEDGDVPPEDRWVPWIATARAEERRLSPMVKGALVAGAVVAGGSFLYALRTGALIPYAIQRLYPPRPPWEE